MEQTLNQKLLPAAYYALPNVLVGSQAQIDVATVKEEQGTFSFGSGNAEGNGGIATAVWAPPRPPLVVATDLSELDTFEVRVLLEEGLRLVAAIELVSPANKNRPSHRHAFASKVAGYLQQQVGVIVVDVITERQESLHEELVRLLDLGAATVDAFRADLYAVAYRAVGGDVPGRLEMWPVALKLGAALPLLPLWIAPDRAIPLDLEESYTGACESLRLH